MYEAKKSGEFDIQELLISVNKSLDRLTMHGLRREVLLRQLNSLSIPHTFLELPDQPSMDDYSKLMIEKIEAFKSKGLKYASFEIYL